MQESIGNVLHFYEASAIAYGSVSVRPPYGDGSGVDDYDVKVRAPIIAKLGARSDREAIDMLEREAYRTDNFDCVGIEEITLNKVDTYYGEDATGESEIIEFKMCN